MIDWRGKRKYRIHRASTIRAEENPTWTTGSVTASHSAYNGLCSGYLGRHRRVVNFMGGFEKVLVHPNAGKLYNFIVFQLLNNKPLDSSSSHCPKTSFQ
ncbi:hypothetical protein PoB_002343200 [Plakobranchus ocellatus]|uniref:Uncharacterized protein n=1 Tax=Plakobranchus ocellatus TaxID=259542 RepID=A0AAV3ZQI5_9GAST|nr:hypothetical protein PoB_002343200 [Plakobranchus ocellatus]